MKKVKKEEVKKEGMMKFGKGKKVISYAHVLEMDDISEGILVTYALNGIREDRGALINWAVNDILKKKMERGN
jgi:hypothetical protein